MRELGEIIKELREKKGTQTAVAGRLKVITSQQLGSYESGKYKPKADFFEAWKREYGEDILAIQKGNIQRNVSNGTENGTQAKESTDSNKNGMNDNKESALGELEVYRKIFEGKTEYIVIPRTVLEKTQLVSIDELERKNGQIDLLIKMLGVELSKVPGAKDNKKKA